MTASSGYSGTPLARKLGIKPASTLCVVNAPDDYAALVAPLPDGVLITSQFDAGTDLVHAFVTEREELAEILTSTRERLRDDAVLWVSWPKKASKVPTTVTEDVMRELGLPLGFVDVKVCAVDAVWSGLKLVVRKELRR